MGFFPNLLEIDCVCLCRGVADQLRSLLMTYAIDTNEKQATEVLLFIFKYSPDLHKVFLEGLCRLSNVDVDENGAGRGRDSLCCSS